VRQRLLLVLVLACCGAESGSRFLRKEPRDTRDRRSGPEAPPAETPPLTERGGPRSPSPSPRTSHRRARSSELLSEPRSRRQASRQRGSRASSSCLRTFPSDEHVEVVLRAFPIEKEEDEWMADFSDGAGRSRAHDSRRRRSLPLPLPNGKAALRVELRAHTSISRIESRSRIRKAVGSTEGRWSIALPFRAPRASSSTRTRSWADSAMTWFPERLLQRLGPTRTSIGDSSSCRLRAVVPEDEYELEGQRFPSRDRDGDERLSPRVSYGMSRSLAEGWISRVAWWTRPASRCKAREWKPHATRERCWVSADAENDCRRSVRVSSRAPRLRRGRGSLDGYLPASSKREALERQRSRSHRDGALARRRITGRARLPTAACRAPSEVQARASRKRAALAGARR
jgi:hypothetical protein